MQIFLSYASEDRALAEEVQLALAGDGHSVFFDRESLPAGGDYRTRIEAAVDACDAFVFLIAPDSVAAGSYALTELGYARGRWPHPKGRVLPVMARPTPFASIPAYLRSVTVLEPTGNLAAEVAGAVAKLVPPPSPAAPPKDGDAAAGRDGAAHGRGAEAAPRRRSMALLGGGAAAVALGAAAFFWLRPPAPGAEPVAGTRATGRATAAAPRIEPPNPLQLRFSYHSATTDDASADSTLRLSLQTQRAIVDGEHLALQTSGYYNYNTGYPAEHDRLDGTVIRVTRASSRGDAPKPARFCLTRPSPLVASTEQHVHLDCVENALRQLHFPSPKWLEPIECPVDAPKTSRGFSLIATAYAATPAASATAVPAERRWAVPSARTLETHQDQLKGVGYTLFDIETDAFRDASIIGVEFDVRVNDVPVYEDALAPRLRPVPNDPAQPFRHTFALESLNFEGAQGGCEAIVLTLRPIRAGGKAAADALSATLPYVALRDMPATRMPFGRGELAWKARYIVPVDAWSHEAFVNSVIYDATGGAPAQTVARERAVALKEAFDRLGVTFQGRPVVGVIRPPLTLTGTRLAYGIAAGVVQPSTQVRFTFSNKNADALADTLQEARAAAPAAQRVIASTRYVYKAAGNAERQATPTPAGICGHVRGG